MSLTSAIWTGVFPAVTTKLGAGGAVDLTATQASIERLISSGVSGVIVLPMLGENAALTQAERDSVVSAAREVVAGRVQHCSATSRSLGR
ncbi:MAG: dihydrodipicolinate synthase family protein [Devosia sp.]